MSRFFSIIGIVVVLGILAASLLPAPASATNLGKLQGGTGINVITQGVIASNVPVASTVVAWSGPSAVASGAAAAGYAVCWKNAASAVLGVCGSSPTASGVCAVCN